METCVETGGVVQTLTLQLEEKAEFSLNWEKRRQI